MARAKQNQEEFIALFRDLPCLWKTTSKDYHDRQKREAAYERLAEKLKEVEPSANKDCVIKKINNMRSSFRKELKKIKESMRTGSGADEVYQPKLWYFELLTFLNDQETPRPSFSNMDSQEFEIEEENGATSNEYTERSNDPFDADDAQSSTAEDDTPLGRRSVPSTSRLRPTPPKRILAMQEASLKGEVLKSVNEHFKQPRRQDDRHDIFGKNVANVLRDVLAPQRILAEKFINDVLFHAEMGTLTTSHRLTNEPKLPVSQHQETPPSEKVCTNSSAGAYISSRNKLHYNSTSTAMEQQSQGPPVYHQLTCLRTTPNLLSPLEQSTEGMTASHFVATFTDDDTQ